MQKEDVIRWCAENGRQPLAEVSALPGDELLAFADRLAFLIAIECEGVKSAVRTA